MECQSRINEKLWNKNFFLLWQGQLVSVLGDVIYIIALDFWILEMTGSTALMGILSALSMLPRIILGPFAGVFVDRWDRKKIIVLTDFIRGIFVTFVGLAAIGGFIQVWMVFVVGIINGMCSAFFNPTIMSTRPDIVPKEQLVKANSVTSLASSSMDMIGSAVGGMLYITIGAPYMFLFNGLSYLFSAFTELFISIPKIEKKKEDLTFIEDFKEGFRFIKNFKLLYKIFISSSSVNFFANAAFTLLVPYFNEMPFLGASRYGFALVALSGGMIFGSILLSVINIKNNQKLNVMKVCIISNLMFLIGFLCTESYPLILLFIFIAFTCNVCYNTIFNAIMMNIIPSEIRGKVMGITSTISMGLVPIGQCIGGVLGEVLPIRLVMIGLLIFAFLGGISIIMIKNMKKLIEFDNELDNLEEIMKY